MKLNQKLFERLLNKFVVDKYPQIKKLESVVEFELIRNSYYDVHFILDEQIECDIQMEIDSIVKRIFRGMNVSADDKVRSFFKYKNGRYEFTCKGDYIH